MTFTSVGELQIAITREFGASRERVFAAWTTPALSRGWIAPVGWSIVECLSEPVVGGKYRYLIGGPDGARMGMGGTYREIVANERIVRTEVHDGFPIELLVTSTFAEKSGRTAVTITINYPSREARDGMTAGGGMELGIAESYDRIEELLRATPA